MLLLVACLAVSGAADPRPAQVDLTVGRASAAPGQTVRIPVQLRSDVGIGALQFELAYDAEMLEFKGVENGPLLPSALVDGHAGTPGRARVAVVTNEAVNGTGHLLTVEFYVRPGAGVSVPVAPDRMRAWDASTNLEVTASGQGGEVTRTVAPIPTAPAPPPDAKVPATEGAGWMLPAGIGGGVAAVGLILLVALRKRRPA